MNPLKTPIPWKYFILLSLALLAANIVRILNVPITHDEGFTFIEYTLHSKEDIVTMAYPSANNHFLNTLLTKFFCSFFGYGIFAIRLTNLLAHATFLYFSANICSKLFRDNWIFSIGCFMLLNLNPFIFEFWGLCRGYGLSLAFMAGSVFYLLSYFETRRTRILLLSLLLSIGAIYSNLALLNFHLGLCATIFMFHAAQWKTIKVKGHLYAATGLVIIGAIIYMLIAGPVIKLREAQQLYYGGNSGFIDDTIKSLWASTLYRDNWNNDLAVTILSYTTVIVTLALISTYAVRFVTSKDPKPFDVNWMALNVLLFFPALSVITQHYLLGTLFIIERTAMFFIPLFILFISYYLFQLPKSAGRVFMIGLSALAVIHFGTRLNFQKTLRWPFDLYEQAAMERMIRNHPGKKIRLRAYWLYAPAFQYYAVGYYQDHFESIEHTKNDVDTSTAYDYYFVNKNQLDMLSSIYKADTIYEEKYYLMKKAN
jgi:hypothetical protein